MRRLSKQDILQASDLPTEEVYVPEWGGSVLVRGMTAAERDRFEAEIVRQTREGVKVELHGIRAKLCAMAIVDEQGNRLFSDEEIAILGNKSASALQRIFEVALRLSRFSGEAIAEMGEELKKGLPSASPSA